MVIGGVVFDLDDTLYLERDYVRSGFSHVAGVLGTEPTQREALEKELWRFFERGVRDHTFDLLLAKHSEFANRFSVAQLVDVYRAHRPTIGMLPGMVDALRRLSDDGVRLGVLSDGPLPSQEAKAEALRLSKWFDPVVLTAAHEGFAKPSALGFEQIANGWGLPHSALSYVADNPSKDFTAPKRLGWRTVRLRLPDQLRSDLEPASSAEAPDVEIADVAALVEALERPLAGAQSGQ